MSDVKLPIKTIKKGHTTIKICVEDVKRLMERVRSSARYLQEHVFDITDEIYQCIDGQLGEFIIGKGVSRPNIKDAYDEEIGSSLAFVKAKLNSSNKKLRLLKRIHRLYTKSLKSLEREIAATQNSIEADIEKVRLHNPDFTQNFGTPVKLLTDAWK